MGFRAVDHCVTIVAFEKNQRKYGMTCAWCMMVDYDKIVCLLGTQSVTGRNINKGDIVGVSSLSTDQKEIALSFGDGHSDEIDKFSQCEINQNNTAITIKESCREMVCEVIDVLHLEGIEEDNLIYLKVKNYVENNDSFLHYMDI